MNWGGGTHLKFIAERLTNGFFPTSLWCMVSERHSVIPTENKTMNKTQSQEQGGYTHGCVDLFTPFHASRQSAVPRAGHK